MSIVSACKLTTFDVWSRNMMSAMLAKNASDTNPDNYTIQNIQTMVRRSIPYSYLCTGSWVNTQVNQSLKI